MNKLLVAVVLAVIAVPAFAQQAECNQEQKGHFYTGTATVRTINKDTLAQVGPIRNHDKTGPVLKDLATCRLTRDMLNAFTGIVPREDSPIRVLQQVSYEVECYAVEYCEIPE